MAIEKQFKVRYGLSVGDDLVTVDGTTGDIVTSGVITVESMTINGTPTASTDAVTKDYVDTAVSSGVGFSGDYNDLTNKPTLATVATSGSYTDLTNKPTLFSGAYADLTGKPTLFSGSYTDLTNKPTIPAAQIQSDWTQTVNTSLDYIKNKPTLFSGAYADLTGKPTLFDGAYSSLTGTPTFATVATTGSYTDLTNKPTIPSLTGYATETYVNTAVSNLVATAPTTLDTLNELAQALGNDANFSTTVTTAIGLKANTADLATVATTGAYTDLSGKPTLFSGSYTDLTNKPTLFSGAYADLTGKPTLFDGAYASLTGKPTSITSFGITDGTNGQVLTTNGTGTFTFTTPTVGLTETDVTKVFASVRNVNGSTITKGQVVYLYGATGDTPTVKLADADADISSATTLGVVYDTSIANGNIGYVITQGLVTGINTNSFAAGDILYLSATAGGLTNVKPVAPVHSVFIGVVVKVNANQGEIYIKPQNGYELDELHNVDLTTTAPTNGQVLTYNGSTSLWTATTPFDGAYSSLSGKPTLATVATTGAYSDLTGKPTLFSGSYTDLTNKPTLFSGAYADLTGKPTLFSGSYTDLTNKPTLFSGAYADLTGKPTSITSFGITDGTNGQVLTTNGSGTFTFTTISSGSSDLNGLTDVTITSPSTGQVLKYNGTQWVNGTDETGGGSATGETFSPFLLAGM